MRSARVIAIPCALMAFCLAAFGPVWAQSGLYPAVQHKRFGYTDPRTGTFHPLGGHTAIVPDASVTTPATGVYQFTVNISLVSTFAKGSTISCSGFVEAESINISTYAIGIWTEEASTTATQTGSTATCTVNVPYSWLIPPPSSTNTDSVAGFLYISVSDGSAVTSEERFSFQQAFESTTLPTNGTTTKYTLKATI